MTETDAPGSDALPWLDLADPAFRTGGPAVEAARAAHWCARTPYGLAVLRHRMVGLLLRDRRLRQGSHAWPARHGVAGPFADWWGRILLNLEGEAHARLRTRVEPAFAPERVAAHVPAFEAAAHRLIDRALATGTLEFVADFAAPYAAEAVATLLSLDIDPERLHRHAVELGLALGVECARHAERVDAAYLALDAEAAGLVARHRAGPAVPFLAELESAGLDEAEARDMVVLAIFGGVDTTRSQLGLAVALLIERPDEWARTAVDPDRAARLVEEAVRLAPTTTWVTREAVEPLEIEGLAIPAGTTLHLLTRAAGTDPDAYPDAGFDPDGRRRAHFGFGGGRHHCLGAHLARADMAAALRVLCARLAPPAPAGSPTWLPESGNTGPERLPLRIAPRG